MIHPLGVGGGGRGAIDEREKDITEMINAWSPYKIRIVIMPA